ncbi:bestrophin family protein [Mucilaginibacter sp. X5P1]|uniref:bestrophin family protein n=1 Tax=Mucilaginibacter sp. X5P1 TaxID=2723088 RepID=UPI00160CC906|nr:bestrophin family ion channel [Mucilaginibacter sp. X5P1]MBB6141444.1 putative membrane protein [Mucilaginibacter sp. X5P1]
MIIRNNENWFRMLFVWQGSVLPKVLPRLLLLLALSIGVVYFKGKLFHYKIPLNPAPFTLFGIALALFLGFRNNASYDRFWEARKLWGALLNDTRSLARQALTISGYSPESEEVATFINYLIAFTYALKHQLRHTDANKDLQQRLSPELADQLKNAIYKPIILMREMSAWVQRAGTHAILRASFDQNLDKLSDIVGGCERIASTPIPYTYRVLLHRTVYIYCFLLPFGFVDSLGWLTPLIVTFIAYTFVALEAIAEEIEDPFGMESNDLALNTMSLMIETTLLEMAGKPLPKQTKIKDYTLD